MKSTLFRNLIIAGLSGLASASYATARPVGDWLGTLDVNGGQLRIVFHIASTKDSLHATMDSPDQGVKDIAVSKVLYSGDSLVLQLGPASYRGKVIGDSVIDGTWIQGKSAPLVMRRSKLAEKPQTPTSPPPYLVEELTFSDKKNGIIYGATLTRPDDKNTHPAVLLVSGSGQQNRDGEILGHKPFLVIADYLTRRGYAVLRVDDRGIGKTTGDLTRVTTEDFTRDASAALNYLKQQPGVDAGKLGIIGHSEGGMIATMLASQRRDLAFIISLAGPGVSNRKLMLAQNDAILAQQGISEAARAAYLQLYATILDIATGDRQKDSLTAAIEQAVFHWKNATPQDLVLQTTGLKDEASVRKFAATFSSQLAHPWFRYFVSFDPQPAIRKIRCKVLAINGAKDIQVVSGLNLKGWRNALQSSSAKSYATVEIPGLNHLFQECATCDVNEYGALEQTISPTALSAIEDWLNKEVL